MLRFWRSHLHVFISLMSRPKNIQKSREVRAGESLVTDSKPINMTNEATALPLPLYL